MPVASALKTFGLVLERRRLLSTLVASSPDIAEALCRDRLNEGPLAATWPLPANPPSRGASLITEAPNDCSHTGGSRGSGCCRVCFDSGLLSAILFLLAMIAYDVAKKATGRLKSWLNLVGAVLFCLEALIDIIWSIRARHLRVEVSDMRTTLQSNLVRSTEPSPTVRQVSTLTDGFNTPPHPLDRIDWDLWTAVFFCLPSLCAILACMADPNIARIESASIANIWNWSATLLYVVDGLLGLCGRWRERVRLGKDAPPICGNWRLIDYLAWGDTMFLVGSLCDLYDQIHNSRVVSLVSYILWTFDALLYIMGSLRFLSQ
mmetsp:Transcript_11007/g.18197  ORF Transcript_11007/g.18197 Transcript_11007/m.18197 type:complete len:319 (-) Transcript_11007:163-1119(-)